MVVSRLLVLMPLALLVAGCTTSGAHPEATAPVSAWHLSDSFEHANGVVEVRLPIVGDAGSNATLQYQVIVESGTADSFLPTISFLTAFLEHGNGSRVPFIQGIGGLANSQGLADVIVTSQGQDVVDTRNGNGGGSGIGGAGRVLEPGSTLVLALAYVEEGVTAPGQFNFTALLNGTASFGEPTVKSTRQAGYLHLQSPAATQACASISFTWACEFETDVNFATGNETFVFWYLRAGSVGSADLQLSLNGVPQAACQSLVGSGVQWSQAIAMREGAEGHATIRYAGAGSLFEAPMLTFLWADIPAFVTHPVADC